jgi:hypothetical protein
MKSSLKTFLAGENGVTGNSALKDTKQLIDLCCCDETNQDFWDSETGRLWAVDVLDDGTAITYQSGE